MTTTVTSAAVVTAIGNHQGAGGASRTSDASEDLINLHSILTSRKRSGLTTASSVSQWNSHGFHCLTALLSSFRMLHPFSASLQVSLPYFPGTFKCWVLCLGTFKYLGVVSFLIAWEDEGEDGRPPGEPRSFSGSTLENGDLLSR